MSSDDRRFDRRSVLKTTGTALVAGTGLVGSASAAPYFIGQRVYPTATVPTYTETCPTPSSPDGPTVYEGDTYYVAQHCQEFSTGVNYYLLSETRHGTDVGWLEESLLDP